MAFPLLVLLIALSAAVGPRLRTVVLADSDDNLVGRR